MDLSIIVPSYNGKKLLQRLLPSLMEHIERFRAEIIVVDNGSTDETLSHIPSIDPRIKVISLNSNYGFTGAVNRGVKEAQGKYVLILNNDCEISLDSLTKLMDFLKVNPHYVATQPIVKTPNGNIENIGYVVDLCKGKAYPVQDPEKVPKVLDNKDIFTKGKVYGLSAACLLIKKDIFMNIGMFDELFHSYLEDVDLCIRLAKQDYRFAPCLNAEVFHMHMSTSSQMGLYKEQHDITNWIRIIIKNYPFVFIIKCSFPLIIERLRNINGYVKKAIKL